MVPLFVTALLLAFPVLLLFAAGKDALSFTIPNWIPLALAALFPVAAFVVQAPLASIGLNVGIGVAVLVAGMAMFAMRWLGGGDAKLLAAAALWLGWPALLTFGLVAALAGGALALLLLSLRSGPLRPLVLMGPPWVTRLAEPGEGVPYGVAIAAGALAAYPQSILAAGHLAGVGGL